METIAIIMVLLPVSFAFLVTFMVMPLIIRVAEIRQIFDPPDERKQHNRHVSALGGVGIMAGFLLTVALFLDFSDFTALRYLFAALALVFILGILDDLKQTQSWLKLLVQLAAAGIIVFGLDMRFTSFQGLFTVFELAKYSSILFTLGFILLVVNAFNFIDGIDMLSGVLGGIFLLAASAGFFLLGSDAVYLLMCLAMLGSLLAFLSFNRAPARIFMGDNGSQSIGLFIAVMAIRLIESQVHPVGTFSLLSAPAVVFSLLSVPLFDTLRVVVARISRGRFPFSPDQIHIHHMMLARGYSVGSTVGMLGGFTLLLFCLNLLADFMGLGVNYLMSANFVLTGLFFWMALRRKPSQQDKSGSNNV